GGGGRGGLSVNAMSLAGSSSITSCWLACNPIALRLSLSRPAPRHLSTTRPAGNEEPIMPGNRIRTLGSFDAIDGTGKKYRLTVKQEIIEAPDQSGTDCIT